MKTKKTKLYGIYATDGYTTLDENLGPFEFFTTIDDDPDKIARKLGHKYVGYYGTYKQIDDLNHLEKMLQANLEHIQIALAKVKMIKKGDK